MLISCSGLWLSCSSDGYEEKKFQDTSTPLDQALSSLQVSPEDLGLVAQPESTTVSQMYPAQPSVSVGIHCLLCA